MSVQNAIAFLEDYLDTCEALPIEVTRQLSQIRELDANCFDLFEETKKKAPELLERLTQYSDSERSLIYFKPGSRILEISQSFKTLIKDGEEKVKLATETYELVEKHIKRLDEDLNRYEEEQMTGPKLVTTKPSDYYKPEKTTGNVGRPRRVAVAIEQQNETPKKRKVEDVYREASPANSVRQRNSDDQQPSKKVLPARQASLQKPAPIEKEDEEEEEEEEPVEEEAPQAANTSTEMDQEEPLYCICNQVSFGEMIGCDNEECAREWFHYKCVGLDGPVKGKWFCPECSELMKKSAVSNGP